ncbi:hypothetical protein TYRP_002722 [Tyrophagus putrescentiae]|nr:hypothetical protein TYRP_002722 [Tyrophagus putrescentiae]
MSSPLLFPSLHNALNVLLLLGTGGDDAWFFRYRNTISPLPAMLYTVLLAQAGNHFAPNTMHKEALFMEEEKQRKGGSLFQLITLPER